MGEAVRSTDVSAFPRLAVNLPFYSQSDLPNWSQLVLDRARAADMAGIDRLVVSDHVVFGENLDAYAHARLGGTEGGRQPTGPDGRWLEPMTVLAAASSVTTNVRLMTTILLAALRRPVVLAKSAATLDVLSGGRLDLGVGVGWQREEYEAAGLNFETRGSTLNLTLTILQTLWRTNPSQFYSEELHFEKIHCMPKPLQERGVPIWISGTLTRRVIDRIVRFGDGWIPWGPNLLDPMPAVKIIHSHLTEAGRDPTGFKILGTIQVVNRSDATPDIEKTMELVGPWFEAGITDFRVRLQPPGELEPATEYLSNVAKAFRAVVGRAI
jgi:probable F420-dependent oxidoreductase